LTGGDDLASDWAGIKTIAFVERDKYCRQVLSKHWPGIPIIGDVKDVSLDSLANLIYNKAGGTDMVRNLKDYSGAVQMYESGFSTQEVADYFGISRQAMWDILRVRGVKMRPQLKYGEENHFYRGTKANDNAQNVAEKAIERGALVRKPCEICGADGLMADGRHEVQAHHDDYNKPLEVRWLCQKHHYEWHSSHKPVAREVMPKEACAPIVDIVSGGFP
jgi:predicted DNA-binding protein YlxM (UPF0122 family)